MPTITVDDATHRLLEHALRALIPQVRPEAGCEIQLPCGRYTGAQLTDAYDLVADAHHKPIRPVLDLSTAHLRPETREMWTESFDAEHFPITVLVGVHGWLMHVPTDNEAWDYRLGTELFQIFDYARDARADYVMFDADASTIKGLPTFEEGAEHA